MEESRKEYLKQTHLDECMQTYYDQIAVVIKKTLHPDSIVDSFITLLEESFENENTHAMHLCHKLGLNKKQRAALLNRREEMQDILDKENKEGEQASYE